MYVYVPWNVFTPKTLNYVVSSSSFPGKITEFQKFSGYLSQCDDWVTGWSAGVLFPAAAGEGFFSLPPHHRELLWGQPSLLYNGYRQLFSPRVKWLGCELTVHSPHLVQRLRLRGALPSRPNTSTWLRNLLMHSPEGLSSENLNRILIDKLMMRRLKSITNSSPLKSP